MYIKNIMIIINNIFLEFIKELKVIWIIFPKQHIEIKKYDFSRPSLRVQIKCSICFKFQRTLNTVKPKVLDWIFDVLVILRILSHQFISKTPTQGMHKVECLPEISFSIKCSIISLFCHKLFTSICICLMKYTFYNINKLCNSFRCHRYVRSLPVMFRSGTEVSLSVTTLGYLESQTI